MRYYRDYGNSAWRSQVNIATHCVFQIVSHFVVVSSMEKSHVTLEQRVCQVCAKAYDTGALLLDRRLQPRFDRTTVTGFGLCADCEKLHQDGYIALVAIDASKSKVSGDRIQPEDAYRTGQVLHMKREAAKRCFNVPPEQFLLHLWFVEQEVVDALKARVGL